MNLYKYKIKSDVIDVLYLFCIILWPILNYINNNFQKIYSIKDILMLQIILFVITFFVIKIMNLQLKKQFSWYLLPCLISILIIFTYSNFCDSIGVYIKFRLPFLKISYLWLLLLFCAIYISWKISRVPEVIKSTKIIIIVVISLQVINLINNYINTTKYNIAYKQSLTFYFKHRPNIYFLLTDAYARDDTLRATANFDNNYFLDSLKKYKFIVGSDAYSNYHFTEASISATMNMDYHSANNDGVINSKPQMYESLRGNNVVRKILKANDYQIINIPAHWHGVNCYGYEDKCIQEKTYSDVFNTFLSSTPMRGIPLPMSYVDLNIIKKEIYNNISSHSLKPKFIFAHLAQVHDAIYDKHGNKHKPTLYSLYSSPDTADRYISSIKYLNNQIIDLVDFIMHNDRESIVIIQADHGPMYVGMQKNNDCNYCFKNFDKLKFSLPEYKYLFGILSAVYVPDYGKGYDQVQTYFSSSPTPVNLFKSIFSYLSDIDPELVPDMSYFLYHDISKEDYNYVDVKFID